MDFENLLEACKAQAILNTLQPTEESVWRSICREYSEKFNTSLNLVLEMDPEEVMLHIYESQLESVDTTGNDVENLLEALYSMDPNYTKEKKSELKSFIKKIEKEEKERLEKGKPIHPAMKDKKPKEKKLPKSGGVNFSYLEQNKES